MKSLKISAIGAGIAAATPVGWMALGVMALSAGASWLAGEQYQKAYENNKNVQDFSTKVGEGILGFNSNPMFPNLSLW